MLKIKHLRTILILSLLFPFSYSFAANHITLPRVLDNGMGDGARYYKVLCPDGKQTAIRFYFEDYQGFKAGDTCYKDEGTDICHGESLTDIAVKACKAKKI